MTETPLQQAMRELRETGCAHCGGPKRRMNSFCPHDYFRLPKEMQRALYQPAKDGYVEAYEAAKAWLAAHPALHGEDGDGEGARET